MHMGEMSLSVAIRFTGLARLPAVSGAVALILVGHMTDFLTPTDRPDAPDVLLHGLGQLGEPGKTGEPDHGDVEAQDREAERVLLGR